MEIGSDIRVDLQHSPPMVEFVCGGRPVWQFDIDSKAARRAVPDFVPRLTALSVTERWEASYLYAIGAFGGVVQIGKMSAGAGTQAQKVIGMVAGIASGYSLGFALGYNSRLDCASPEVYAILNSKTAEVDCQPDIWRAVAAPKLFSYGGFTKHEIEFPASSTLWKKELLNRVANGNRALEQQLENAVESYSLAGFHAHSGTLTGQDLTSTRDAAALILDLYQKNHDRFKIQVDGKMYDLVLVDAPRY